MKYSVLMTVYKNDNPQYFKLALESVLSQTVSPNEIVIVKDGQITNELQKVIDTIDNKSIPIVQIQLKQNVGLGLALNEGIKKCKNELIARMDADDISLPDRCERQLELFFNEPKLDIVGSYVKEFSGEEDNIVGERKVPIKNADILKFAKKRDPFNHPTVMYKRSKVLKVGGYGNFRKNQDTDLWIKMLYNGCFAQNIDDYLLLFRFEESTFKRRKSWLNTKLLIKIRWNAYKIGFSTFGDFLIVTGIQMILFIMPIRLQKIVYKKVLRRR